MFSLEMAPPCLLQYRTHRGQKSLGKGAMVFCRQSMIFLGFTFYVLQKAEDTFLDVLSIISRMVPCTFNIENASHQICMYVKKYKTRILFPFEIWKF